MANEKNKRIRGRSLTVLGMVFGIMLLLAGLIKLIVPDQPYSATEQRNLTERPVLSVQGILDGSFMERAETWMADQFPGRSMWVKMASALHFSEGIREEKDTVKGKDGYLFERFRANEAADETLDLLVRFMEEQDLPGQILLAPDALGTAEAGGSLSEKIPRGFPTDPENRWLENAERRVAASGGTVAFINPAPALAAAWSRGEQVYYRTDHHWTTLGAYRAFEVWKEASFPDEKPLTYSPVTVCENFRGTLASRLPYTASRDSVELFISEESPKTVVTYPEEQRKTTSLYSEEGLSSGNPYQVFFGGNYGTVKIETTADSDKKLLLIKDSYANCFVPFLTPFYSEITLVDPRYYNGNLRELILTEGFDSFLYAGNANTFNTNTSLKTVLEAAGKGGTDE